MKKRNLLLSFLPMLVLGMTARVTSAALFQNLDTACGSQLVLCSTGDCPVPYSSSTSLACKSIFGPADFNKDGYADCVAALSLDDSLENSQNASVLINSQSGLCSTTLSPSLDYRVGPAGSLFALGNIAVGDFNNDQATDLTIPQAGQRNIIEVPNPGSGFGPDGTLYNTLLGGGSWNPPGDTSFGSNVSQPTLATLDCNQDGNQDSAVVVYDQFNDPTPGKVYLNLLKGNGVMLKSDVVSNQIPVDFNTIYATSLTVNDFDGDGDTDVAVAVSQSSDGVASLVAICRNEGQCLYDCSTIIKLDQIPNEDPFPDSIASGDFDGDGDKDLAVSTPGWVNGKSGVQFFINNGSGTFSAGPRSEFQDVTRDASTLAVGCFDNNNREDLAVVLKGTGFTLLSNSRLEINNSVSSDGLVGVVMLDSTLTPQTSTLQFPSLQFVTGGLAVENLHDPIAGPYTNGDDIVAVGVETLPSGLSPETRAFLFFNEQETLSANAGPDQQVQVNQLVNLKGVCALNPDDPKAEFAYEWSVVGANPSNVIFSGTETSTPTFIATKEGTYTLNLKCRTTCRVIANDTVQITVKGLPGLNSTSGGCASNSLLSGSESFNRLGTGFFGVLLFSLAVLVGIRSFKREV